LGELKMAINDGRFDLPDGETVQQPTKSIEGRGIINKAPDFGKAVDVFESGMDKGIDNIIGSSSSSEVKKTVGVVSEKLGIPLGDSSDEVAAVVDAIDSNNVIDGVFRGFSNAKSGLRNLGEACLRDLLSGLKCTGGTSNGKKSIKTGAGCSIDALRNMISAMGGNPGSLFDPCALKRLLGGVTSRAANTGMSEVFSSLAPMFDPSVVIGAGAGLIKNATTTGDFELFEDISNSGFGKEIASVNTDTMSSLSSSFKPQSLRTNTMGDLTKTMSNYDDEWDLNNTGMTSVAKTGGGNDAYQQAFRESQANRPFDTNSLINDSGRAEATEGSSYVAGLEGSNSSSSFLSDIS
jgi:hypothetical protein